MFCLMIRETTMRSGRGEKRSQFMKWKFVINSERLLFRELYYGQFAKWKLSQNRVQRAASFVSARGPREWCEKSFDQRSLERNLIALVFCFTAISNFMGRENGCRGNFIRHKQFQVFPFNISLAFVGRKRLQFVFAPEGLEKVQSTQLGLSASAQQPLFLLPSELFCDVM